MSSLTKICRYALNKVLPYNNTSDRVLNYIKFIDDHDILLKKGYYLNDYLFGIKNTDEILNLLFFDSKNLMEYQLFFERNSKAYIY